MYFTNYVYFSPLIINIQILELELDLSTSIWMSDRWAWPAHAPQIYCFSPVLGVLSMFT